MKVGDKKQATILGVVAAGAILFLCKTAFDASSGGGSASPAAKPVDAAPTAQVASASTASTTAGAPSLTVASSTKNAVEEKKLSDSFIDIGNDGFVPPVAKPEPPVTPPVEEGVKSPDSKGSVGPTCAVPTPVSPTLTGNIGFSEGDENTDESTGGSRKSKEEGKTVEVRFFGFIEEGKKLAILAYGDSTFTVHAGDKVGRDITVVKVDADRIILKQGTQLFTVMIGEKKSL